MVPADLLFPQVQCFNCNYIKPRRSLWLFIGEHLYKIPMLILSNYRVPRFPLSFLTMSITSRYHVFQWTVVYLTAPVCHESLQCFSYIAAHSLLTYYVWLNRELFCEPAKAKSALLNTPHGDDEADGSMGMMWLICKIPLLWGGIFWRREPPWYKVYKLLLNGDSMGYRWWWTPGTAQDA